ncbi:response regulator, partial [archaeon]
MEANRKIGARQLQRFGCVVDTAVDGGGALELVLAGAPADIIAGTASAAVPSYPVPVMSTTATAWLQERHWNYDLIVLDVHLATMDGDVVCSRLRALGCALPIIACTGNTQPAEVQQLLNVGFTSVLSKPFDSTDLKREIVKSLLLVYGEPHAVAETSSKEAAASATAAGAATSSTLTICVKPSANSAAEGAAAGDGAVCCDPLLAAAAIDGRTSNLLTTPEAVIEVRNAQLAVMQAAGIVSPDPPPPPAEGAVCTPTAHSVVQSMPSRESTSTVHSSVSGDVASPDMRSAGDSSDPPPAAAARA